MPRWSASPTGVSVPLPRTPFPWTLLIALTQIGMLDLLRQLFGTVVVPPNVCREVAENVQLPTWTSERRANARFLTSVRRLGLDPGESDVIALALEVPSSLVILDDLSARKRAERLGLSVIGTVDVLLLARQRRLVPAVRPYLDALLAVRFHISAELYEDELTQAEEE